MLETYDNLLQFDRLFTDRGQELLQQPFRGKAGAFSEHMRMPASLLLSKSLLGASAFLPTSISVNYPLLEQCGLSIWYHSSINTEGHRAGAKVRSIQRLGASRRCHAYSQRDMLERTSEENGWIR